MGFGRVSLKRFGTLLKTSRQGVIECVPEGSRGQGERCQVVGLREGVGSESWRVVEGVWAAGQSPTGTFAESC